MLRTSVSCSIFRIRVGLLLVWCELYSHSPPPTFIVDPLPIYG